MRPTLTLIVPALLLAPSVLAHGIVSKLIIDGKSYTGDIPNGAANPSVIRQVSDASPVKGATNPFVNCGFNAGPAKLVANANPGSNLQFAWTAADGSNWPHNTGPMLTYMASCGSTTCDQFDSTTAKWFKIEEVGRDSDGTWAQQAIMNGALASVSLPSNLAAGNYLIRHEIIALHLAMNPGGAEFYPSCSQLSVGGSGTGAPTSDELVSLPGAYSDTDSGILVDAYDTSKAYVFPGPAIAAFVGGNAGSSSGNTSATSTAKGSTKTSSAPTSTKTGAAASASSSAAPKQCKLKKKTASSTVVAAAAGATITLRPRHVSRIMRGLVFGSGH